MIDYVINLDVKLLVPIITAVIALFSAIITFFLNTIFTLGREKKAKNTDKRAYLTYMRYNTFYPIRDQFIENIGKGLLLLGENGDRFDQIHNTNLPCRLLVLTNSTSNDVLDVKVCISYIVNKEINEELTLQSWSSEDKLYFIVNDFDDVHERSHPVEFEVHFRTLANEKLTYSYKYSKKRKGYQEVLSKKFLGLKWRIMKYHNSGFQHVYRLPPKRKSEGGSVS